MSGVVGTRASRRHGSRAAAHDQVRSACSRAVPTNVFQARNISYMPSILNLAISLRLRTVRSSVFAYSTYFRSLPPLLRLIRVTWCTVLGGTESK